MLIHIANLVCIARIKNCARIFSHSKKHLRELSAVLIYKGGGRANLGHHNDFITREAELLDGLA